eukprot:NODE_645_length_1244_cov_318.698745_g466_i0.p1 GENE.NODE_645_length_1244_cov_318.698745_g466_i0~~NODE_645_length_1244_cov_318.698745_g466_i0.p1  ORF type:complete len:346 (-),score=122.96 NODE_645_length_1244_cov_318.698745_g466_i0:86-1123(-)
MPKGKQKGQEGEAAEAAVPRSIAVADAYSKKKKGPLPDVTKQRVTVLKNRKSIETLHFQKVQKTTSQKGWKKKAAKHDAVWKSPHRFVSQYRRKLARAQEQYRRDLVAAAKYDAQPSGVPLTVQAQHRPVLDVERVLLLVTRTAEDWEPPAPALKVLASLGLDKRFNAVFIIQNPETAKALEKVSLYVDVVRPDPERIRFLLHSDCSLKTGGPSQPLSGNAIVEKYFGHLDIICLDDMLHELVTVGPKAEQVIAGLMPFQPGKLAVKKMAKQAGLWAEKAPGLTPHIEEFPYAFAKLYADPNQLQPKVGKARKKARKVKLGDISAKKRSESNDDGSSASEEEEEA